MSSPYAHPTAFIATTSDGLDEENSDVARDRHRSATSEH